MKYLNCVFLFFIATGSCKKEENEEPKLQPGDVTFSIATREHPQPKPLNESDLSHVKKRRTIININGWMHNTTGPTSYFRNITEAYLNKCDYNVILVHADHLMFYTEEVSVNYTNAIGKRIADLIVNLHEDKRVSLEEIHIVGHALGAHIGGAAGRKVEEKLCKKIYRITALEVSKVGFENAPPSKRLDKSDAIVVDVIHTAAGQVGLNESVGSADFWPNGGSAPQPGCSANSQAGIHCSHDRSIWYFIYTIRSHIRAVKCDSYTAFQHHSCTRNPEAVFGDNYNGKVKGNLYLYLQCSNQQCVGSIA